MSGTYWVLEVKKNRKGELYIELPPEITKSLGWKIGDRVIWEETKNGWIIKKAPIKRKCSSQE